MIFVECANCEWWSQDDRFCVAPTPEGWVAIDHRPECGKIDFSDVTRTREEAEQWCREKVEPVEPSLVVEPSQL